MRQNLPVSGREFPFPSGQTLVSVTDLKGRITYCNDAFRVVSGFAQHELLGQPHNLVRHPDMPEEAFRDLWATVEAGRPWTGLVKNRRKNGDHYWVRANATPMFNGGRIVGYLSVRSQPQRAEVDAAEALYSRLSADAAAGRAPLTLRAGRVVRRDLLGRLLQALRPGVRGQVGGTVALAGAAGAAVALAGAPWPLVALVATSAAAAATWAVLRWTMAPLQAVVAEANRLASGDLAASVSTGADGPLGQLQEALAQLAVNLRTVSGDVRGELEQLRGAIREIAAGNQDLSSRTEGQASSLQQTAASMEQIAGTARNSADSAEQGARMAREMAELAARSQQAVQQVQQAMQGIAASASRMGDIIHVIEGVAFQTNILALNAAVEAARAGEAGRGFAVVAGEVRMLAQRSADAAREIKLLIRESGERVATGNSETASAAERMVEALQAVQQVRGVLDEVARAAGEQQAGVAQISEAVMHMDGITQQNAALVEQLAASGVALGEQVANVMDTMALLRLREGEATLAERDAVALRREARAGEASASGGGSFDFGAATAAHAQWKIKLRGAAGRGERLDADEIGRDDACTLGQWLHGAGRGLWGHQPAFTALVDKHREFHRCAGQVAAAVNAGRHVEAGRMLDGGTPFARSTNEVTAAIQALKAATAAERPRLAAPVPAASDRRAAARPVRAPAVTVNEDEWEAF